MPELLLKGFQESFRGEVRPATIRVMHDGDVVDVEKMARDTDRQYLVSKDRAIFVVPKILTSGAQATIIRPTSLAAYLIFRNLQNL